VRQTEPTAAPSIVEIALADDPERWESIGFAVSGATVTLGDTSIRLEGTHAGRGILSWSLCGGASDDLDGLPTELSAAAPTSPSSEHPNKIVAIDHVVAMTPALDRSVGALQRAGLDLRRIREEPTPVGAPRQAFFRLGQTILEVVQVPDEQIERAGGPDGPARFWGLALLAADLDLAVALLADHASEIRPAVQTGRRIATLRRSAGLSIPVALMSRADQ
jgi:hypothetical protein